MSGYLIIEVIVALCLVYLTYSLLTSILVEVIDTLVNLRGRSLRRSLKRMLQDEPKRGERVSSWFYFGGKSKDLVNAFYSHPSIKCLGKNRWYKSPSNIPDSTFSKVLIAVLSGNSIRVDKTIVEQNILPPASAESASPTIDIDPETKHQLGLLYEASGRDLAVFKQELENWFNNVMSASTDWYKKFTARIAFVCGLTIAIWMNVDTLHIGSQLIENTAEREELIAMVDTKKLDPSKEFNAELVGKVNTKILSSFGTGICNQENFTESRINAIIGWLITALAISFGAPFWFDLLNKFMRFKAAAGTPVIEESANNAGK